MDLTKYLSIHVTLGGTICLFGYFEANYHVDLSCPVNIYLLTGDNKPCASSFNVVREENTLDCWLKADHS